MPLIRRRAFGRPSRPTVIPHYPPGRSPLENLPVEILITIFVESQNIVFPLLSRTLWEELGYKPPDWLVVKFFTYNCEHDGVCYCLNRAMLCRGFSISAFLEWQEKWTKSNIGLSTRRCLFDKSVLKTLPSQHWFYAPYLPRRWLRPAHQDVILNLLRSGQIRLRTSVPKCAGYYICATYFENPGMKLDWAFGLIDYYTHMYGCNGGLPPGALVPLLKGALRRNDVTPEMLDCILRYANYESIPEEIRTSLADLVFNGRNTALIVSWALRNGCVPTSKQLGHLVCDGIVSHQ